MGPDPGFYFEMIHQMVATGIRQQARMVEISSTTDPPIQQDVLLALQPARRGWDRRGATRHMAGMPVAYASSCPRAHIAQKAEWLRHRPGKMFGLISCQDIQMSRAPHRSLWDCRPRTRTPVLGSSRTPVSAMWLDTGPARACRRSAPYVYRNYSI